MSGIQIDNKLRMSQARVDALMADFSGLVNLEEIVADTLQKLAVKNAGMHDMVKSGAMSLEDFDAGFSEVIRKELGRVLGIVRAKAVAKASAAGAGSAASAVLRRMYRNSMTANINIGGNRQRISGNRRQIAEPNGGESGIRRTRTVKPRTKTLREYFGPDRSFILRILNSGRDEFYATGEGPSGRGSKATYGRRGSISARNFFHSMSSDMEQAAQQLGETLVGHVEKWVEQKIQQQ